MPAWRPVKARQKPERQFQLTIPALRPQSPEIRTDDPAAPGCKKAARRSRGKESGSSFAKRIVILVQARQPSFVELFTSKLVTILRERYGFGDLRADIVAGLIVALPLSMGHRRHGTGPFTSKLLALGEALPSVRGGRSRTPHADS